MKTLLTLIMTLLVVTTPLYIDEQPNIASIEFNRKIFKSTSFTDLINLLKLRDYVTVITVSNVLPNNSIVEAFLVYRIQNSSVDAIITIGRFNKDGSVRDFIEAECRVGDSIAMLMKEIRFYKLVNVFDDPEILDESILYKLIQRKSMVRELGIDLPEILYGFVNPPPKETIVPRDIGRSLGESTPTPSSQQLREELKDTEAKGIERALTSFLIALITASASYVILKRLYL